MLRAGCPPDAVARALADYVLSCPVPPTIDARMAVHDETRLNGLVALTAECVLDAAVEMAARSAMILEARGTARRRIRHADRR
jgi:hypothetical protein